MPNLKTFYIVTSKFLPLDKHFSSTYKVLAKAVESLLY